MALVSELELPAFDYTDPSMRGERFHAAMRDLSRRSWLAQGPYGYMVLDRESAEFFLRTRAAIFPGMKIAEIFGVSEGPLYEQMKHNILHVNGADHARLRGLVNPALSPRAVERYRPAMRVPAGAARRRGRSVAAARLQVRCEFVEAFAKPYPSQVIAHVMGAPLQDAPRLHHWSNWIQRQFDAVSMATERDGIEVGGRGVLRVRGARSSARGARPPRRPDLDADRSRGGRAIGSPRVECINLVFNVLVGGVDTSQSQLAHAVRLLAEAPRAVARCCVEDPSLAEAGGRGGAALRADHAVHRAHPHRGRQLQGRELP